jgi:pimeloyl-ACP methyl ester carboxylesterase
MGLLTFLSRKKAVLVCVHGLGNKPPSWLLAWWWKKAVREGLRAIGRRPGIFRLEFAYWADILYPQPLSPFIRDRNDFRFIREPYARSGQPRPKKKTAAWKIGLLNAVEYVTDVLLMKKGRLPGLCRLSDDWINRHFKDLEAYYDSKFGIGDRGISSMIGQRLKEKLQRRRGRKIMLIAHSMGSIIAFDVLQDNPELEVDALVTLGSPLGLPYVLDRIIRAQGGKSGSDVLPAVPDALRGGWHNFSDLDDKVAVIYRLARNFRPNRHGVAPVDRQVDNDYTWENSDNPHKSYGYLRAPEVAAVIGDFLDS